MPPANVSKRRGSTIVEYGLIGLLILAVSVGALAWLSVGLNNNVFRALKKDVAHHANAPDREKYRVGLASQPKPAVPAKPKVPGIPKPEDNLTTSTSIHGNTLQTLCFQNGVCVNVPIVNAGSQLSSTSGALGGQLTKDFADVFWQIAQQLAKDPNADKVTLDLVTKLANKGHGIANRQRDALKYCRPGHTCQAQTFTTLGAATQPGPQTSAMQNKLKRIEDASTDFQTVHGQLQAYLNANPHALDPGLVHLINFEAGQITTIAEAYYDPAATNVQVADSSSQLYGITTGTQSFSWNLANDAQLTAQSANTICATAGNTAICTR